MLKRNPENERIKRRYLIFLKEAKGRDEASIDGVASAIDRLTTTIGTATSGASILSRRAASRRVWRARSMSEPESRCRRRR